MPFRRKRTFRRAFGRSLRVRSHARRRRRYMSRRRFLGRRMNYRINNSFRARHTYNSTRFAIRRPRMIPLKIGCHWTQLGNVNSGRAMLLLNSYSDNTLVNRGFNTWSPGLGGSQNIPAHETSTGFWHYKSTDGTVGMQFPVQCASARPLMTNVRLRLRVNAASTHTIRVAVVRRNKRSQSRIQDDPYSTWDSDPHSDVNYREFTVVKMRKYQFDGDRFVMHDYDEQTQAWITNTLVGAPDDKWFTYRTTHRGFNKTNNGGVPDWNSQAAMEAAWIPDQRASLFLCIDSDLSNVNTTYDLWWTRTFFPGVKESRPGQLVNE